LHPLRYLFEGLGSQRELFQELKQEFVPVTSFSRSHPYKEASLAIAKKTGRICIRIKKSELESYKVGQEISKIALATNLDPQEIDLVIDLEILRQKEIDSSISLIERSLPDFRKWRSLTILSGSFPKDLQRFKTVGRYDVSREEWHFFDEQVLQSSSLAEVACFGDYTIQHPIYEEPPKGCNPSASIRYAVSDSWIIMKGEGVRKKGGPGYKQYNAQAQVLSSLDEYHGSHFSYGCQYVAEKALNRTLTGSCQSWLAAMINHHMTVTVGLVD